MTEIDFRVENRNRDRIISSRNLPAFDRINVCVWRTTGLPRIVQLPQAIKKVSIGMKSPPSPTWLGSAFSMRGSLQKSSIAERIDFLTGIDSRRLLSILTLKLKACLVEYFKEDGKRQFPAQELLND